MNLRELWNLVSSYWFVYFKLVFLVNSDFSTPIFFLELVLFFLMWCFLVETDAVKFSTRSGWNQRILIVDDFLRSDWHSDFRFFYVAVCFLRGVEIPKELIFDDFICCKSRFVVFYYCHLLVFRFSWWLLAFFSNVMFLHFDLTLSGSLPEMDETREPW